MTSTGAPGSMRAWHFTSTGGGMEKNMQINKVAPSPASDVPADKCLVKVSSMALNPVDYKFAEMPLLGRIIGRPASPGLDFSGRIVAVASHATSRLRPGQMVFGRLDRPTQFGSLAEYTLTPQAGTVAVSEFVDPNQAAAMGTAALTAYQCIAPHAKAGDWVFVNGGSGGCGTHGIQIAKAIGCKVAASCSTPNVELCKSLGADEVIDYKTQDVTKTMSEGGQRFVLVVDNVGTPHNLYSQSQQFLKPDGKFVQVAGSPNISSVLSLLSRMLLPGFLGGGKRSFSFMQITNKAEDFQKLGQWLEKGQVKPIIEKVYDFDEAVDAYARLKTGRTKGKLVVKVAT